MSGVARAWLAVWFGLSMPFAGCGGAGTIDPLAPIPVRVTTTDVEPVALRQHWSVRFELDIDGDEEPDAPTQPPALGASAVFVAYNTQMLARGRDNGDLLWQLRMASEITLPPIAIDDGVLIATRNRWLWLDSRGRTKQTFEFNMLPLDTATIGRRIYVADSGGIYGLRLSAKATEAAIVQIWRTELPGASVLAVSLPDERLFVVTADGRVHALNVRDGSVLWTNADVEASGPRPATIDGTLFVIASDYRVIALDADNGKRRWRSKEIGIRVTGAPAISDDIVWVAGLDAALHGYAIGGGSHKHRIPLSSRAYIDLAAWGRWVIASPQAGPWTLVRGPLRSAGPANPGLPRVVLLPAQSDVSLAPGVGPGGVAVVEANGTVRLFTPQRGPEPQTKEQ